MADTRTVVLAYGGFAVLASAADKLFGTAYIAAMDGDGLSAAQISIVLAIGSVVLAVVDLPTGALADSWGRKRTAAIGSALLGCAMLLYAAAARPWQFVAAMTVWAVGTAMVSGAPTAWVVDELDRRGATGLRTVTFARTGSVALLAGAVAAVAAMPLLARGPGVVLVVAAVVCFVTAVALLVVGDDNRGEPTPVARLPRVVWANATALLADRTMRLVLLKGGLRQIGFTVFIISYQIQAIREVGLPRSALGALLAVCIVAMAAGSWIVPRLARRLSLVATSALGVGAVAVGLATMAVVPMPAIWIGGLVLVQVGLGADMAAFGSWVQDVIPAAMRASWLSAGSSVQTAVGVVGTLGAGLLADTVGYRPVWLGAALATAAALVPLALIARASQRTPVGAVAG